MCARASVSACLCAVCATPTVPPSHASPWLPGELFLQNMKMTVGSPTHGILLRLRSLGLLLTSPSLLIRCPWATLNLRLPLCQAVAPGTPLSSPSSSSPLLPLLLPLLPLRLPLLPSSPSSSLPWGPQVISSSSSLSLFCHAPLSKTGLWRECVWIRVSEE